MCFFFHVGKLPNQNRRSKILPWTFHVTNHDETRLASHVFSSISNLRKMKTPACFQTKKDVFMKTFGRGDIQLLPGQWDSLLWGQGSPEEKAPVFPVSPETGLFPFQLRLAYVGIHSCLLLGIAENNWGKNPQNVLLNNLYLVFSCTWH